MKSSKISRFILFALITFFFLFLFSYVLLKSNKKLMSKFSVVRLVFYKVDNVISFPVNVILTSKDNIENLLETYSENEKLRKQIYNLQNQETVLSNLEDENKKIKSEFSSTFPTSSLTFHLAKIVKRLPVSWYDEFKINVGKSTGIQENAAVLSEGYLVGYVSQLNSDNSTVRFLNQNTESLSINVKISTSSGDVFGVLKSYSEKSGTFSIDELTTDAAIPVDSLVYTSGLDGKFPEGLKIGKVTKFVNSQLSTTNKVLVKSSVDTSNISFVTVVSSK